MPLYERAEELARLRARFAAASGGEGSVVVIEGAAGVGKTSLVTELIRDLGGNGAQVLRARGGEFERDFAFGIARQLFERELSEADPQRRATLLAGSAELAEPALGLESDRRPDVTPTPGDAPFAVIHGLYWLLYNLTAGGPTLIAIDDAQWADVPSLRFLDYVTKRIDGLNAMLLIATRSRQAPGTDALLPRLCAEAAETIELGALSEESIGEILSAQLGAAADVAFARACRDATAGNPFLVHELVAGLRNAAIEPRAENAELAGSLVPHSISRLVEVRLSSLSAEARRLANAIAVLGDNAELRHACAVAEVEPAESAAVADAMVDAQLLASGRPLEFVHPIVREAVYAALTDGERARLHGRAFSVLCEAGPPAVETAAHLLHTEPAGSERAVSVLRRAAADAIAKGAVAQAQRYLARALDEPPTQTRAAVLGELAVAELLSNRDPEAAIAHARESLELTERGDERLVRALTLARSLTAAGRLPEAAETLEAELSEADGAADDEGRARLRAELDSVGLMVPELTRSTEARIRSMSELEPATSAELLLLANVASNFWGDGAAAEAASLAQRALADGELIRAEGPDTLTVYQLIWVLAYADRFAEAQAAIDLAMAESKRRGSAFGLTGSYLMSSLVAWRRGQVHRCESEARAVIDLGEAAPAIGAPLASITLTHALIETGRLEDAEQAIALSGCGPNLPELIHTNPAFHARARLRLAQGRPDKALEDIAELARRDQRLNVINPGDPWRETGVQAHLILEDRSAALGLAEEHLEHAHHWNTPSAIGVGLRVRGLAREGDGLEDLRESIETLAPTEQELEKARSHFALGCALARWGDRVQARDPLRTALDTARRCGASALMERAREELVATGAKPRRLSFSGAESLTASERRIAVLAAQGHTNRDIAEASFVTIKTVENHLNRCYQKLGISSRQQLRDALGNDSATNDDQPAAETREPAGPADEQRA